MGGVAGIRAVVFFSSTYFGEISIFELSKDPASRIWSTLMNPEQFLILVTYLIEYLEHGNLLSWNWPLVGIFWIWTVCKLQADLLVLWIWLNNFVYYVRSECFRTVFSLETRKSHQSIFFHILLLINGCWSGLV
jgi:hypothetical protein